MSDFILEAIDSYGLTSECKASKTSHFDCTLSSPTNCMQFEVQVTSEPCQAPTTGQLLYFLANHTQSIWEAEDFEDWADDCECESSDPEAKARYGKLARTTEDLIRLLGQDGYEALMAGLEISQAIAAARPPTLRSE